MHEQHGEQNDGLEWEDLMPEINRASEPSNMRWMLIDRETGAENGAITWAFTVGDRVKIRLVNEMESDHPMHHPFHVHGAGRFLVLSREGEAESNFVWKDTVLVPAGPWMSCSTSPIRGCGWRTATSPSTLKAG
jgi:FtsP/CotA-like multicopper oxidase with cupredoxin domain